MGADEWEKIKALFSAALEQEPASRSEFVAKSAGDDIALRESVESLLASHDDANDFLETPAAALHAEALIDSLPASGRIGPYRLVREIGHGGMGTVHLATRDDGEFRHEVAIKLVKRGMDTVLILRRFRHERQILAELDHPNIARLLDGGTTDDGRPYFVMEYIDGEPIDRYCASAHLDVADHLRLYRTVCGAVQYAHRNLIVHRDIKASNILVTEAGVPKLLDFGIAKLLDTSVASPSDAPETAAAPTVLALTPEYASPEQVRGDPITTVSDVYSLGVLLYELLAGRRPYEVSARRPDDIARIICGVDPLPPSEAVVATDSDVRRRLRGDVDNIVLKAMHKDPSRRYQSVEQLSEDLRRWLDGLPVTARRDTVAYRAAKFVRRNRVGVAAAAIIVVSLVAGLATTVWQARVARAERARAERRFNEVRTLATSFLFEMHDAIANLPGSTAARSLLVTRGLASLDGLAREAGGDPTLQRDLASAYERVGSVQGNSTNSNLGDTKGALESYRKSLAIRERLAREHPQSVEFQTELARGYEGVGDMLSTTGDLRGALQHYERARGVRESIRAKPADDAENRVAIVQLYRYIGDTKGMDGYANLGDVPGALEAYRQSVRVGESLLRTDPHSREYRAVLANSLMNLGFLGSTAGDTTSAIHLQRAINLFEEIVAEDPNDAKRRMGLNAGLARMRFVLADAGKFEDAIRLDHELIASTDRMFKADAGNAFLERTLGVVHNYLGRDLRANGQPRLAIPHLRMGLAISQRLAAADAQSTEHQHDVAMSHYYLAEALADAGDRAAALEQFHQAATMKEGLRVKEPTNSRHGDDLALIYTAQGSELARSGAFQISNTTLQNAVHYAAAAEARAGANQKAKVTLALAYLALGKAQLAAIHGDRASEQRRSEGCMSLQKSLDLWLQVDRAGRMPRVHSERIAEVARELRSCDATSAK